MSEKHRVVVDLRPEQVESLDRLAGDVGAETRAETLRMALRLAEHVARAQAEGGVFMIEMPDGRCLSPVIL